MDVFIRVFLPLTLVIIMFSLGLGLRFEDFKRVFLQPKAFAIGVGTQIVGIPAIAYALALLFRLPPELALGLMILSFCPSGVTSNFMTKVARGDVALAVSLTGVSSLTAVLTMPILVKYFAGVFLGQAAPEIDVTALGVSMFLITAVPVAAGIALRRYREPLALALDLWMSRIATILFVVAVGGAIVSNWQLLVDNIAKLGPSVVSLNVALLIVGLALAKLFGLGREQATTIAIESGVHNATLGITVGTLIAGAATGLPIYSLPSGLYGVTMYLVAIPFVWWRRSLANA
ncbi:MAG: bile acid:sodium symporter family protein [Rhizobiaceae bacterium]